MRQGSYTNVGRVLKVCEKYNQPEFMHAVLGLFRIMRMRSDAGIPFFPSSLSYLFSFTLVLLTLLLFSFIFPLLNVPQHLSSWQPQILILEFGKMLYKKVKEAVLTLNSNRLILNNYIIIRNKLK